MVHGMIVAVWEAIPQRWLNASMVATSAYLGAILFTYRADMLSAKAIESSETKTPKIMQRASINEWMQREEKRIAEGKVITDGPFNTRIKTAPDCCGPNELTAFPA